MIGPTLLLALALPQDLKQAPEILRDPAGQGIGKRVDLPALRRSAGRDRVLVVAFAATDCPISKLYRPRLERLAASYAERGVSLVVVHGDAEDLPAPPALHDADGRLAAALGARRSTDLFVIDAKEVLRYRGALDDQYGIGYARAEPSRNYLVDALEAVLAGNPVPVPATEAPGCVIESARRPVADGVSYHRDVAPVLLKRCAECHRPGEVAPFPLLTYAHAKAKARTIRLAVEERRMPPWFADPKHGVWLNDRRLTDRERDTILRWADAGAPEGELRDAPTRPAFREGWAIGTPDEVWELPVEVRVPAEGTLPYKYYTVRTRLKEDRWVRAIEIRPGARAVVHHVLVFVQYPRHRQEEGTPLDGGARNGYFGIMVPGERPLEYPEGMGKVIPAGASLVFQMHYTATGEAAWDRSAVGVRYWDRPPEREVFTRGIANTAFRIPPGAADHEERAEFVFARDSRIVGFMPHLHVRGKAFRYEAVLPDGRTEILLDIPRYDFNWQYFYRFREPRRFPKGTRIRAVARWDNSAGNPANPDPAKTVRFGEQTWDEMLIGYMDFVND
jgi:thiol-disulfide isomerase/thioredoxin